MTPITGTLHKDGQMKGDEKHQDRHQVVLLLVGFNSCVNQLSNFEKAFEFTH